MYPALVKSGYREPFSLGLVTSAGSLGILIPPSIPMIVYSIMVSGSAQSILEICLSQVLDRAFSSVGCCPYTASKKVFAANGLSSGSRRGMIAVGGGLIAASVIMVVGGMSGMSLSLMLGGVWLSASS